MTKYKKAILDIINTSSDHPTAEGIYKKMVEKGFKPTLSTVYNNLISLLDDGLIKRISTQKVERYDNTKRHDHLICSVCGNIKDVYLSDKICELEKDCNQELISYDLKMYHVCSECR